MSGLDPRSIFSGTVPPIGDELADTPLPPPVSDPEPPPDNFFSFFFLSPSSPRLAGDGVMVVSVKLAVVNLDDNADSGVFPAAEGLEAAAEAAVVSNVNLTLASLL